MNTSSSTAGDWDGNGTINSGDFFSFVTAFLAGSADVDGDGSTTANDVPAFFDAFLKGSK